MNVVRGSTYISFALVSFLFEIESHAIRRPDLSAQCPVREEHNIHKRAIHLVHDSEIDPLYCETRDVFLHPRFGEDHPEEEEFHAMPEEERDYLYGRDEDAEHLVIEYMPTHVETVECHEVDEPVPIVPIPVDQCEVTQETKDLQLEVNEHGKQGETVQKDGHGPPGGDFVFPKDSGEHVKQGYPNLNWEMFCTNKDKSSCVKESNDMHKELYELSLEPVKNEKSNDIHGHSKEDNNKNDRTKEEKSNEDDSDERHNNKQRKDKSKEDKSKEENNRHNEKQRKSHSNEDNSNEDNSKKKDPKGPNSKEDESSEENTKHKKNDSNHGRPSHIQKIKPPPNQSNLDDDKHNHKNDEDSSEEKPKHNKIDTKKSLKKEHHNEDHKHNNKNNKDSSEEKLNNNKTDTKKSPKKEHNEHDDKDHKHEKEDKSSPDIHSRFSDHAIEAEDKAIAPSKNGEAFFGKSGDLLTSSLL